MYTSMWRGERAPAVRARGGQTKRMMNWTELGAWSVVGMLWLMVMVAYAAPSNYEMEEA